MTLRCYNCGERCHTDEEEWRKTHIHPNMTPRIERDDS